MLDDVFAELASFLDDQDFATKLSLVFGDLSAVEVNLARTVIQSLVDRESSLTIEVQATTFLRGANAAFDRLNNRIYLSDDFLSAWLRGAANLKAVLLEEIGHYIDTQIHPVDALGDEGAIFAAVVQGETLSESQLTALKTENDAATIEVNGQPQTVEFSAQYGTTTLDGLDSDWSSGDRIATASSSQGSFDILGKDAGDTYLFAVKSNGVEIGNNTTFFLNTDQNVATGGSYGNEFFVNFFGSQPHLYGSAGNWIKPLEAGSSSDGTFVEFAVAKADIGTPTAINLIGDINDSAYFPADYSSGFQYTLAGNTVSPSQTTFGPLTLNGNLSDWTASDRLDRPGTTVAGYEVYGQHVNEADAYVFAIKAPAGTQIGENTTFWLDTDRNSRTGYSIFGMAGAEYQINIDPDGKAYLYKATNSSTLERVSNTPLPFSFGNNREVLEFAVPTDLLGGATPAVDIYADVNNQVFLPGNYATNFTLFADQTLPTRTDPSKKVAIVYSETTAKGFFGLTEELNKTAYSQLFMSIQDEVMMAGLPFDLINESDLKDLSKLVNYDALIFPAMRNVNSADLQAIEDTLTQAVYQYGISLIAAGDFLTNDETGASLPDAYSRMNSLLGLGPRAFGTGSVSLQPGDVSHPAMAGYDPTQSIHDYQNIGWAAYQSLDNIATNVLVQQTINGQTNYNAVVTTQTGGKNIHFATTSYLGDNDLLWQALQDTIYGGQPSVGLAMTRNNSIFLSRNDMDLSQENYSVNPEDGSPGIYDRMLPIVEQWKQAYNFIGSYYINIGNNPADGEFTDWNVSSPYYQALLAAGNEIGTHSYTHFYEYQGYTPAENTNVATAEQLEFEFNQSQLLIEQKLGINVTGTALPGAPETISTAQGILPYFDYISGGYSGIGAGYPSAFGYMLPGQSQVYLAPNMYFDFTLLQFGIPVLQPDGTYKPVPLTATEAAAEWVAQFNELSSYANKPIMMMPWHDYGPTNWDGVGYTIEMFTALIEAAYTSGAEFITLDQASRRIKAFESSQLFVVDSTSNTITATVLPNTGNSLGAFALDLNGNYTIQSVSNWYAYDVDSVFLPAMGGTFTVNLGPIQDDVTHINQLPMRGELLSLWGNGEDLQFSFIGDGQVMVDLKNPRGMKLTVSGADSYSLNGEILTLNFSPLNYYLNPLVVHNVSIDLAPDAPPVVANPIATVEVLEDAASTVIDLSQVFTDGDGDGIAISILNNSNPSLLSASLKGALLTLTYLKDQFGSADITLRAQSGNQLVDHSFSVNVAAVDDAPVVQNPTANITVTEPVPTVVGGVIMNTIQPLWIDLSQVFTDVDNDPNLILKSVQANSNPALISTSLEGNQLTLNFAPAQFGTAQITVSGTSNGLTVDNTFMVTANPSYNTITGTSSNNFIDGTRIADAIYGLAGADKLNGKEGNDVLYGGDGDDDLKGAKGNDILFGGAGSDKLDGEDHNDVLYGNAGFDTLKGGKGDDQLFGGVGNDKLQGEDGNDTLIGGMGADQLEGGNGLDTLIGIEPTSALAGQGEIDLLKGNGGSDTFVLGDRNRAFYNDGIAGNAGLSDYALIEDFNLGEDLIQLWGTTSSYRLGNSPSGLPGGTAIYLKTTDTDELIGVVKGINNLSLTAQAFSFQG
ncbi:polysaccharide deacetylase [filamentous cyanobacterium CCP5]|nr:polysaccharide deacetylase [filamentous cyanobacterium CCP5]